VLWKLIFILWHLSSNHKALALACVLGAFIWFRWLNVLEINNSVHHWIDWQFDSWTWVLNWQAVQDITILQFKYSKLSKVSSELLWKSPRSGEDLSESFEHLSDGRYRWDLERIEIWVTSFDSNQLCVDTTPELLKSTGRFNVVFDPEKLRVFPGTISVWAVITGRVRSTYDNRRIRLNYGRNFTQFIACWQMKKQLACELA